MRQQNPMNDQHKTKAELITELAELRQEVSRLQAITEGSLDSAKHKLAESIHYEESRLAPAGENEVLTIAQDITQRKQAEVEQARLLAEVQQNAELLRNVLDTTPDWIFAKDQQFKHILVSKSYADTLGKTPAEIIGKDDLELGFAGELVYGNPAKGVAGFRQDDELVLTGESISNPALPATTSAGVPMILDFTKIPLRNAHGNIFGILGFGRNITERVKIEEALLRQNEELKQTQETLAKRVKELKLLNEIGYEIAATPPIPQFLQWVCGQIPPAMQYPHLTIAAILYDGQTYGQPEAVDLPCQIVHALRIGNEVVGRITIAYRENRSFLDEESALIGGIAGRLSGYIESQRLVEQIQQQKELLDKIIDNLPVGVFAKNAQDDYRFTIWNAKMEEMFGVKREEMLGKNDYDLFTDQTEIDYYRRTDVSVMEGGQAVDIPVEEVTTSRGVMLSHTTKLPIYDDQDQPQLLLGVLDDITERKQAEDVLRRSQEQLSNALKTAQLAYWEFDVPTQTFTFNDQFYALLYTTAEQEGGYLMPAMHYAQRFVHSDDAYLVGVAIREALETTDPNYSTQLEHRIIRADGSEGYIVVRFRVIKDEQGRTVKTVGANQDITDRKQVEEALRESQQRIDLIMQGANLGTWDINLHTGEGLVDQRAIEMLGYSLDEVQPHLSWWSEQTHPDDIRYARERWNAHIEGKTPFYECEYRLRTKSGEWKWILDRGQIVEQDKSGQPLWVAGTHLDITERKRAEETLRQNEALLRTVIDSTPDWIFIKDQDHRYRLVNQSYAASMKLSPEDFVGKNDLDIGFPEDIVKGNAAKGVRGFWADDREVMNNGETKVVPEEPAVVDGQPVWLSTIKVPLRDAQNQVWGVLGFVHNITERKRVELERERLLAQVREALTTADRFRQFVEASAQGIGWADLEGNVIYINPTLCRLFGEAKPEDVYGRPVTLYYPEEAQRRLQDEIFPTVVQEGGWIGELPIASKDGRLIPTLNTLFLVRDENSQPLYLANLLTDITEPKQAEEALRQSEATTRILLEAIPDLMIWMHRDGTHLNLKVPRGFDTILAPSELIGKKVQDILPAEIAQKRIRAAEQALQTGEAQIIEYQLSLSDGIHYEESRIVPAGENEVLLIVRDITDRKQAEQALQEAQERAQIILESVTAPMIISRVSDGVILYTNAPMARLMLLEREELTGQQTPDFYDDPAERAQVINLIRSQGYINDYELCLKRSNGEIVWTLLSARLFNFQGEAALITILIDITERKQIEEALQVSRERLTLALEGTQDGIWDWDIVKGTLYWSPRFMELLGYDPDDLDESFNKFESRLHPDDEERVNAAIAAHLKDRVPYNVEERLRTKSGEYRWFQARGQAIWDELGNPTRMTGALTDITADKAAAAERERLLAEVEAAYRQYVQREWEQFLGERPEVQRTVFQQTNVSVPLALDNLAHLEQEVLREGKTKTLAPVKTNGYSTEATIVAPLSLRGQVIGALSLQDIDPNRAWTAEEITLVETVSEQLALTVENLRLFEDTQKQATREQITRQITDKMRAAPDMDAIIQTGLTELAKALNLSRAYVKLTTQPEAEQS
ncbi:MAG: PAS domain S-box protein [Anaerolineae bacterium]